jgi:S1-C subfamily serine protease
MGMVGVVAWAIVAGIGAGPAGRGGLPADRPIPSDDQTFRPTVLIRKGAAQGSGTVVASVPGETLVLTAAHVVEGSGPIRVELHRYNLGLERVEDGAHWPRGAWGEVVASDPTADVAVVRVRGIGALPYVARIAPGDGEPSRGTVVTSLGIDGGTQLSSWASRIDGVIWFAGEEGGDERPFLLTARSSVPGRSGGGLFLDNGELVGVCIGRTSMERGRWAGLFASTASIRQLLRDHDLDVAIAQARRRRPPEDRPRVPITTTRARPST